MKVAWEHVTHPDRSFRFLRFETEAFRGAPHRHRHLELTWIEAGDGLRLVGDSATPFEAGDLVLLGSNTPHCWISSQDRTASAATVVQFAPDLLNDPTLPELLRLAPLAEKASVGLLVGDPCRRAVTDVLARMSGAGAIGRLAGLLEILELLALNEHALAPVARSPMRPGGGLHGEDLDERRIDRVIGWIHRRMDRELTVAEAARVARITPGAFSRFFRHEVGKTFTEYVNDVRCSEACIRLRRSEKAVTVIAQECGFATMSHFNRQFRLRHGSAPRTYRRGHPPGGS
jgi:AraC-like DNA-binding protein